MTTALLEAASTSSGLNLKGFVIVAIVFALVYPIQKRLRESVSRRRVERWREEDARRDREELGPPEERRDPEERGAPEQRGGSDGAADQPPDHT